MTLISRVYAFCVIKKINGTLTRFHNVIFGSAPEKVFATVATELVHGE